MKLGHTYKRVDGRFPFDCLFGIYIGETGAGWPHFVWDGKDMAVNGGNYEEVSDAGAAILLVGVKQELRSTANYACDESRKPTDDFKHGYDHGYEANQRRMTAIVDAAIAKAEGGK